MKLNKYSEESTENIGENLKKIMQNRGMSVYKLHKLTGLSKPTIYNVLRSQNRKKDYSIGALLAIDQALGFPIFNFGECNRVLPCEFCNGK